MRHLTLDFLHPLPRPHWAGWLLLAAGVALAGWSGWQGVQTQDALDAAVAAAPRAPATAVRRPVPVAGDVQSAAREAREQLSLPWGDLFARLEAHRPKSIALIGLEADARKPEATVTAEARSAKDMLAWIEQLKAEAGFATVTLASHAVQENDPQQPLRFVLRLRWKA